MISLASNTIGIGLAVQLRDGFTAKARSLESEFNRLHGSAQRVMRENLRVAQAMGIAMTAAGIATTRGMNKALHTYADFQHVMRTVELVTNATADQMRQLDALATELGTNTIFNPQEIASGMEYLAKAGYSVENILKGNIQAATFLAAALDKKVGGKGGTADFMTHIMKSFQIPHTGAMNVANWIAATSLSSTADLEDIHEALIHVSGTAMNLNIPLEHTLALLAKLSDSGLRGSIGGTSLNNFLIQFSNAIGPFAGQKDRDVLKYLGINLNEIVDAAGNMRPVIRVLNEFDRVLSGMGNIEKTSALNTLLNIRGGRAVAPLLRTTEGAKSVQDFINVISKANAGGGVAQDIALKRMSTLWGSFERLGDTVWNFFKTMGQVLQPIAQPIIDFFIDIVQLATAFVQTPMGKAMLVLAAATGTALLVVGGLLTAFTTIKLLTLASTFSFSNMGKSLVLAWTQGAAAAARYATVARGAMAVSTPFGVRWKNMATGKFTKAPVGGAGGGFFAFIPNMLGGLRGFVKGLGFAGGALRILGGLLRIVTGPIGWIVAALSAFGLLKDVVLAVVYGLGTLLNALIWVVQSLWAIITNPIESIQHFLGVGTNQDLVDSNKRFQESQERMAKSLGMMGGKSDKPLNPIQQRGTWDEALRKIEEERAKRPPRAGGSKTNVKMEVDGKVLGNLTLEDLERLKVESFGVTPISN